MYVEAEARMDVFDDPSTGKKRKGLNLVSRMYCETGHVCLPADDDCRELRNTPKTSVAR